MRPFLLTHLFTLFTFSSCNFESQYYSHRLQSAVGSEEVSTSRSFHSSEDATFSISSGGDDRSDLFHCYTHSAKKLEISSHNRIFQNPFRRAHEFITLLRTVSGKKYVQGDFLLRDICQYLFFKTYYRVENECKTITRIRSKYFSVLDLYKSMAKTGDAEALNSFVNLPGCI